ncbi:MFS transporter [Rhodococcus maanshanensis]|uniref:Benzoate transport n=1 Tax=Rhodococcus maanshanensis TaxID=183556 RepID=A0A1H7I0N7_9NOCA|nr:MFS transporter [Rhodococcus maanshanensis]SEK56106.1 benzoate transport [Rhodococcus maanshanensis]
MDISTAIKKSPMSRFQYLALTACLLVLTIDGFDVFVMGFVLPHLPDGFFASSAEKGYLLSAGLAGMAVGSLLLSPLGDRFGRRKLVLWCLVINFIGLVASAMAPNVEALTLARLVTGLGIGGMTASLTVLVQEYSSEERRNAVMGVYTIGFPLGSLVGGFIGTMLIGAFGGAWQAMFVFGAVITGGAFFLTWRLIPESIDFLIARDTPRDRAEIASVAVKLRNPAIDPEARPALPVTIGSNGSIRGLFERGMYYRTLLSWLAYSCVMAMFYFASFWTPELIKVSSGSKDLGTTAGLILSLGGVVGALVFGVWTLRISAQKLLWIAMLVTAVAIVAFATFFTQSDVAIALTVVIGLFTFISITGLMAVVPQLYAVRTRSTALGWMIGIGRLFSIAAPIVVGYALMVAAPRTLYFYSAVPMLIGAAATYALWRHVRGEVAPMDAGAASAVATHTTSRPEVGNEEAVAS